MNILKDMKAERRIILSVIFLMAAVTIRAQNGAGTFGEASMAAGNGGMYVLGGWALANMAAGVYGWATNEGEKKYFILREIRRGTIEPVALLTNHGTVAAGIRTIF